MRHEELSWTGKTNLGSREDILDGDGNLRANAITLDQTDQVVALVINHVNCQFLSSQ